MKSISEISPAGNEKVVVPVIPKRIAIKVEYGYKATKYVILDNMDDVCRAIYAKTEKIPVTLRGRFISGQEIKEICPDIYSYTGWYRGYDPVSGDDFAQIERDVPEVLFDLIDASARRVEALVASEREHLIGKESIRPELLLKAK